MLLSAPRVLQLTLAVIKPDAVAHPVILEALHQRILGNNFVIVKCKDLVWRRQDSERFYAEHSGRFFYQRLVEFMSSGPMRAYVLAREDAIRHWRELMGPTKVFRARYSSPATIRAEFGLTDTRNTTHGSDSVESAQREIRFFFPDFCAEEWMEKEEPSFRSGRMHYDHQKTDSHTFNPKLTPEVLPQPLIPRWALGNSASVDCSCGNARSQRGCHNVICSIDIMSHV